MHAGATAHIDPRAGASWLAAVGPAERLQLLATLLTRFNHEFRTPLNTIVGWGYLLQQDSFEASHSKHVADVIARNAGEQSQMLEAFIDDGRLILERLPLETGVVRIEEVVGQAIERASPALQSRGVALHAPRVAGGVSVEGDSRQLQRLVDRLIAVVAKRARDNATIEFLVFHQNEWFSLSLATAAADQDWSEPDLLELRLATLMASMHKGGLELLNGPALAALRLQLPVSATTI